MFAIDAERGVLGSCMIDRIALDEVMGKLTIDDFSTANKDVFRAIRRLYEKNETVDAVTVSERLQGNPIEFTTELATSVPTTQNAPHYIKIVREFSQRRKLHELGLQLQSKAFDIETDVVDIVDYAERESLGINLHDNSITPMPEIVDKTLDYIERCHQRKGPGGIKTGYWDLDYLLKGLQPGSLTIIAARPSMGKTAFALNIASYAAIDHQHKTFFASAEQTQEQIVTRLISARCRIDNNKIKLGQLSDIDWETVTKEAAVIANSCLVIDDKTAPKVSGIRSKARKEKVELIVVDHLTELWRERKKDDRIEHEMNVRDCKRLAKDLNIPVILLQQLNRACEARRDKRPMLSDLKETGASEEVADIVMFLYRDDYYNPESKKKNITEVIVAKGRDTGIGTIELLWMPQYTKFSNLER
jgi:replicative DNA helicase